MAYKRLAGFVSWFHWIWVLVLVTGPFVSVILPWYRPIHMVAVAITVVSQLLWLGCPLVALEYALRRKGDPDFPQDSFTGSFICYFLKRKLGLNVPPGVIAGQLAVLTVISCYIWLR